MDKRGKRRSSNGNTSNGNTSNGNGQASLVSGKDKEDANGILKDLEVPECPPQVGYCISILKSIILYPLAILPLCVGLLFAYWFPHVWIRLTCWKVPLKSATYVIVKDQDGKHRVERVHTVILSPGFNPINTTIISNGTVINPNGNAINPNGTVFETVNSEVEDTVLLIPPQERAHRYFTHRHLRYFYNSNLDKFVILRAYDSGYPSTAIHELYEGLSKFTHQDRLLLYGQNSIDVPVKPYYVLLIDEVLHPFYIFQILSVTFWILDHYYLYAGVVLFISTLSVLISLVQTRRNLQQLHDMVFSSCTVTVIRDGREVSGVASEELVPGDVVVIPPTGMTMPCDAALLSGTAIVNEAMLTGESVPVTKTPLPQDSVEYHPDTHKRHTFFSGTHVIQTRFYSNSKVTAVVVRTGFMTSKGGMVRTILFPKPLNMKFYSDAVKFVLVMAVIAMAGFIYTITILQVKKFAVSETILRAFDVITTVVPPSLPAALTIGTVYALNRLRKQQIYCISPQRVNLCGKIKLVCFDKTGTLTEDSLDLFGVSPSHDGLFSSLVHEPCTLTSGPLLHAMASCHSLTKINGELTGDPLDIKMFNSTKWTLSEPAGDDGSQFDNVVPTVVRSPLADDGIVELGILKMFTFSSELQRMGVLVRSLPSTNPSLFHSYVKGAPETIKTLCRPETVPSDYFKVLGLLTQQGFRVLAVGHKVINMPWHRADRANRDVMERDLEFVGLIVMQNRVKPQTTPIIKSLLDANIRLVMITGDNMLTAVSVARECKMVPASSHIVMVKASLLQNDLSKYQLTYHLMGEDDRPLESSELNKSYNADCARQRDEIRAATPLLDYHSPFPFTREQCHIAVDGKTFEIIREHFPDTIYQRLLVKGTVFARMSPTQKTQLVISLMDIGYGVCMCGDGANDCGALKVAHAGISLSETEASIASPFTSKIPNISCVPIVIKEGRAALVTSFSVFKFMALYSFAEFISVAILYSYESNLGDMQYLYIDLVVILALSFAMGYTAAYPRLVKRRPPGTLAGVHVLLSIAVHTLLVIAFQLGVLYYLSSQPWFVPLVPDPNGTNILCSENTIIFQISLFQYVGLSIALSKAAPFRKPFFTNLWLMLSLAVLVPANLYLILAPPQWVPTFWKFMELAPTSSWLFRIAMLEFSLLYVVLAFCIETFILPTVWMHKFLRVIRCKRRPSNRYKHILSSIPQQWPPLTPANDYNHE